MSNIRKYENWDFSLYSIWACSSVDFDMYYGTFQIFLSYFTFFVRLSNCDVYVVYFIVIRC